MINKQDILQLISQLQKTRCESQTVEVKAAKQDAPNVYDTLSSFSNQNQGGVLLFGLDEKDAFAITGVYDLKNLQDRIAEQCEEMEPKVNGEFLAVEIEGKFILALAVPPVPYERRPCYKRNDGVRKGSYTRLGQFDKRMSEFEILSYTSYRERRRDDLREVKDERAERYLNNDKIQRFLLDAKLNNPNTSQLDDDELKILLGLTKNGYPTISEVLVFSSFPQAVFPQLMVTAVVVPGYYMGETDSEGRRFTLSKNITGTISEMIDQTVSFVLQNSPNSIAFDKNGKRIDTFAYPPISVREAIANALVHRDYSLYSEAAPVRVEIYKDRLEILSPGGLYGDYDVDELGTYPIPSRNPNLINILTIAKVIENRYSGIPTIYNTAAENKLPAPVFKNEQGYFKVIFYNGQTGRILSKEEQALIEFCDEGKTREEIATFLHRTSYYAMKRYIEPLISQGYLCFDSNEKKKSKYAKIKKAGK